MIGVAIAFIVGISGKSTPLGLVGPGLADAAIVIGGLAFAAVAFGMYRWVWRMAQTSED